MCRKIQPGLVINTVRGVNPQKIIRAHMQEDLYRQLASRIAASDEQAFDELFRTLYAQLVSYSFTYTKDKETAVDITQQAFIKLWQKRMELDVDKSIKAYMYRIVRNLSLNHNRDTAAVDYIFDFDNLHNGRHTADEPFADDESADTPARMKLLEQWISSLPERQKDALMLSKFDGLDHQEIAEIMEVSKNTVNNHIVAAIKNLKKRYYQYLKTSHAGYV